MATPSESSYRSNPSPPSSYPLNSPIDRDKELPPMPQLLEEETPSDSGNEDGYHPGGSSNWMDIDSGTETDDTGEHP